MRAAADVRLKRFAEEKTSLKAEVQLLTQQLEEIRAQRRTGSTNGPLSDDDYEEAQRKRAFKLAQCNVSLNFRCMFFCSSGEANKQLADYRYKLQRAEQEIASLQSSLSRSETQVIRFKGSADASEKAETDLKSERRKLQREVSSISPNCSSRARHPRLSLRFILSFARRAQYPQPTLILIWDECHLQ